MKKSIILVTFICLAFFEINAQAIVGKWNTVDEETGKVRSVVEISEKNGVFIGKIVELFPESGSAEEVICDKCNDYRKDQKVLGMQIVSNMKYKEENNIYKGGRILDPKKGKEYKCEMWLDKNKHLKVRGYISFLYRTQTWMPYSNQKR